jgi:hypothetical protein
MYNLTFYKFTLSNKAGEQQVLNLFNDEEDLLETMNDFCSHIYTNIKSYTDVQGKYRTLSLANNQIKDDIKRIITGYLASAHTGEYGKIQDGKTSQIKYDILKADLVSKDFFYLIHVPKNSKHGFLIFQKKENHGVKVAFESAFNTFMKSKGISNYYFEVKHAPARYLINKFLKFGKLREFRLISSVERLSNMNFGREERVVKLDKSANIEAVKNVLIGLFDNFSYESKIPFLNHGEFDEITFVINHDGISKTFYIKDKEKIRTNVNVSTLLDFEDGEATLESLIRVSLEIINKAA